MKLAVDWHFVRSRSIGLPADASQIAFPDPFRLVDLRPTTTANRGRAFDLRPAEDFERNWRELADRQGNHNERLPVAM